MKVGQEVMVALKDHSQDKAYPWDGKAVPVKIIGEYEFFWLATVLPHRNPNGLAMSRPYNVTLSKQYIKEGAFVIQE